MDFLLYYAIIFDLLRKEVRQGGRTLAVDEALVTTTGVSVCSGIIFT
jgi:hypothetical protein